MITTKNLDKATEQEVFDQLAWFLLHQKEKSRVGSGCVYRDFRNNNCCVAGMLIPDTFYAGDLEGKSWAGISNLYKFSKSHQILIRRMQSIHDNCPVEHRHKEISELSEQHGLNKTILNKFKNVPEENKRSGFELRDICKQHGLIDVGELKCQKK